MSITIGKFDRFEYVPASISYILNYIKPSKFIPYPIGVFIFPKEDGLPFDIFYQCTDNEMTSVVSWK